MTAGDGVLALVTAVLVLAALVGPLVRVLPALSDAEARTVEWTCAAVVLVSALAWALLRWGV